MVPPICLKSTDSHNTTSLSRIRNRSARSLIFLLLTASIIYACTPREIPSARDGGESTSPPTSTITIEAASPTASESPAPTTIPLPSSTPTATTSPTPVVVRFAVIGDYGLAGEAEQAVADLVLGWEPDFIITTGDNNYPNGAAETIDANIGQYYHGYIAPYQGAYGEGSEINRFFPTLGNHDWTTNRAQPYLDYFTLPGNERYYDVLWEFVHIFAIDSDSREPDGIGRSSIQAAWLKEALSASDAIWKIVCMHHPPFSSGLHGSIQAVQWPYAEWGATTVIAGHDHLYERLIIDGFPYFTNGLGGSPARYTFGLSLPGSQVRYRDNHGALLVEARVDSILFQFITVAGEIIDSYTIEAQANP